MLPTRSPNTYSAALKLAHVNVKCSAHLTTMNLIEPGVKVPPGEIQRIRFHTTDLDATDSSTDEDAPAPPSSAAALKRRSNRGERRRIKKYINEVVCRNPNLSPPPPKVKRSRKKNKTIVFPDDATIKRGNKFRGVRLREWGRWAAEIRLTNPKVRKWVGSFDTAVEAAMAYDEAVVRIQGSDRAKTNFPLEISAQGIEVVKAYLAVLQSDQSPPQAATEVEIQGVDWANALLVAPPQPPVDVDEETATVAAMVMELKGGRPKKYACRRRRDPATREKGLAVGGRYKK